MIPRALAGLSASILMASSLVAGPASGSPPPTSTPAITTTLSSAAVPHPKWSHVMGVADLNNHPVRNARVSVRTLTGQRLTLRGPLRRTGRTGVFHVRVRHLPEFFLVEVRHGRFGHRPMGRRVLRSIGWAREPGEVVNQASTIAAYNLATRGRARLLQHPKRATRRATAQTAHLLGLHNPRHRFSLGLAGRTRSVSFDPARAYRTADRQGFNNYLRRLGRQAGTDNARRYFRPKHYHAPALGSPRKGTTTLGIAPACEGITECLLVVLKNTAVSLVGSAAHAGICQAGGSVSIVASLAGCGPDQQLKQIVTLLNAMNEQLTNMEQQLTTIVTMLAEQAQTTAYNESSLPQLQGVIEGWLLDMLLLADPAVAVAELAPVPVTASMKDVCAAAYPGDLPVPGPYEGYAFTQTPNAACMNAGENTDEFVAPGGWATSIFDAMTGYPTGFAADDLLAPTYQTSLSNGGTQFVLGEAQNTLNQLLSSFIGLQSAAFQLALAWQTFEYAWTDQDVTCPATPLPTQFPNPASQALLMTGPCSTALTSLYELSLEAYIAQQLGPRAELPPPVVLDTYGAVGVPDVPMWWGYAVDAMAATAGMAGWPFFPGYDNYVAGVDPTVQPTTSRQIAAAYPDTFTFGTQAQNTELVQHALDAYKQQAKSGGINGALAAGGFHGPGQIAVTFWAALGNNIQTYAFTDGTSCNGWPDVNAAYNCTLGVAPYVDTNTDAKPNGAGVLGTYATTVQAYNGTTLSLSNCPRFAASWDNPPYPVPPGSAPQLPSVGQICATLNDQFLNPPSVYGLLSDTTAGSVLWDDSPFQGWQDETIPVIASN